MWSGLTKKLKMQSDAPNVLGTSGDDRPDETTDLGIDTLPLGGTDHADRHNKGQLMVQDKLLDSASRVVPD